MSAARRKDELSDFTGPINKTALGLLIASGYKDIENRDWWTNFRGDFLIHAGKAMDDMSLEEIIRYYDVKNIDPSKVELLRGGIIGRATLVDCVSKSESKWFHGKYGFKLTNNTILPFMPGPFRLF